MHSLEDRLAPGPHVLMIDGLRQRYHVAGSGPVCVVHPGGPGAGWEYLRMPDVEENLTLVYVEPIGTGESDRLDDPRGYTPRRYARQVGALVEQLGLSRVHFLGHSYGGFVGQQFALDHPDRLAGLVLYDTSPYDGPEFRDDATRNLEEFVRRHPEATDVEVAWTTPDTDDASATDRLRRILPVYLADYRKLDMDSLPEIRRWYQVPNEDGPFDVRDTLGHISAPTLILVGQHDFICGPHWARMLYEGIAGSRLVTFADSGHLAHIEEPENFAGTVAGFILDQPSS